MIKIREYRSSDWNHISGIHDAARMIELTNAKLEAAFIPLKEAADKEDLFAYTLCVAEWQEKVVGFGAYLENEIGWLYVDPEYMRKGIGTQLVQYMMAHTKRPLEIEVLAGNDSALKLYEKMGFQTKEILSGVMPGNETFAVSVYCLELSDA